jgi:hypothetical protein
MCIKNALITLLLIPTFAFAQIKVDDVGDGWKPKVDSAISLIQQRDPEKYEVLIKNCNKVEFIIGDFSTTKPPNVIAITTKDMKIGSINNIAAILVHESYHLKLWNEGIKIDPKKEEKEAYHWEYDFLCKLSNVEDWLFLNAINQIIKYSN